MITHCLVCKNQLLINGSIYYCNKCYDVLNIKPINFPNTKFCCFEIKDNFITRHIVTISDKWFYIYRLTDGQVYLQQLFPLEKYYGREIAYLLYCDKSIFAADDNVSNRITKLVQKMLMQTVFK